MIILLHAFLVLVAAGSILVGLAVIFKRLQMFRIFYSKMGKSFNYSPPVSIIAPVRGFDEHTEENILSLFRQDYKNKYEVIFVLDKDDKKTEKIIKEIISKNKIKNAKFIKNKLFPGASGKSSALVAGTKHAKNPVIVSYDSDAQVRDTWLSDLVAPLSMKKVGAATGFRFYMPSDNFRSYVLSAWNSIGFIGIQGKYPFTWGGSFALKKDLIKKLKITDLWKQVISDDSAIARKLMQAELKSYFVPGCIALSYYSKFSQLKEFTTRQFTIIRYNWPFAYRISLLMFGTTRLSIVLGLFTLLAYIITNSQIFLIEAILLLFTLIFELIIALIDYLNFSKILGLKIGSLAKWCVAYLIANWLMFYNILATTRKKTIMWRGREYDFKKEAQIL